MSDGLAVHDGSLDLPDGQLRGRCPRAVVCTALQSDLALTQDVATNRGQALWLSAPGMERADVPPRSDDFPHAPRRIDARLGAVTAPNYVPFGSLSGASLVLDQVYEGGTAGHAGDDPLSRLPPVGNQGGFRYKGVSKVRHGSPRW